MTDSQADPARPPQTDPEQHEQGQTLGHHPYQHGRPVSWVLVGVIIAAFTVGGVAVVEHWWVVFWVALGIVVLCVPAGMAIGIMKDTVVADPGPRRRLAVTGRDSAADPGVRLD